MSLRPLTFAIPRYAWPAQLGYEPGIWADPVNGNDSTGTGTSALPYKTIAKCLAVSGNGATINLKTGLYHETNSTALTFLMVRAGYGHTPTIVPAETAIYTSWSTVGGRPNTFQTPNSSPQTYGVYNGATRLTAQTTVALVDANTNSFWLDTTGHVLYVNIGGSQPATIYSLDTNNTQLTLSGASCVVDRVQFQYSLSGLQIAGGNSQTISNSTFQYFGGQVYSFWGLNLHAGTGHTVSNCVFNDLVSSNGVGVSIDGTAGTVTVSNSTFNKMNKGVLRTVSGTTNVSDCSFTNIGQGNVAGGDGVDNLGAVVTTNVTRCTFVDCSHGMARVDTTGSVLTATLCLGYLTVDRGENLPYWGMIVDGGSAVFEQCTVANLKRNTTGAGGTGFLVQSPDNGTVIKNCIAYNCKNGFSRGVGTWTEDYNCAFGNSGTNFVGGGPNTHDLTIDPLFVDQTNNDYHLQAGSPCIGAAVAIAGVSDAGTGATQPPNIGRYTPGLN